MMTKKKIKKQKCKAKDCNRMIETDYKFCSIECACYAGEFSVTKGWLNKEGK